MEFRNQDKSLRRQMVIDAAVKVFHQKGYRAATLDDVASELGLTKPALYHYVSSKEDLLSQIYLRALESFFQTIYEIREMDLSPLDKLRCFVRRHLEQIVVKNLAMFSVFFSEENELPRKDFLKIRTEKRKFSRVVEDIIQEGIDLGIFRAVDPRLQANAIIGMCNWLYRWYRPGRSGKRAHKRCRKRPEGKGPGPKETGPGSARPLRKNGPGRRCTGSGLGLDREPCRKAPYCSLCKVHGQCGKPGIHVPECVFGPMEMWDQAIFVLGREGERRDFAPLKPDGVEISGVPPAFLDFRETRIL
ncbi:MAG: TetR family transcriptional regulator [Deltaproteobacteria bacterium]|nr:TetR family transcriptional regulator [Deltaproteobacteria bacterium]